MADNFYRAFEEKYRGSRELIKSRLQDYIPFVLPVFKAFPQGLALDVGCGRGEWLELLSEHGLNAKGVDLDEGMLQACRVRGLQVETADALVYMQAQPDASLCIVSGFHIAEHLPFDVLQQLVQEAKRVLVPGGLLILETPNPENISVGTNSFYLDPTHERPIPAELLSFLPEHYGYARFKVLRLQEDLYLRDEPNPCLMNVLNGVSPDYAVVAQTQGVPMLMEALLPAFEQSFGLTLLTLAERYQASLDTRLAFVEAKAEQAAAKAEQIAAKAEQIAAKMEQALTRAEQAELTVIKANEATNQLGLELEKVYRSKSWQITAPLRWLLHQFRLIHKQGLKLRVKAGYKRFLKKIISHVARNQSLRKVISRLTRAIGVNILIKQWIRPTEQKQLLVDVSSLVQHDHKTGIQRVVKGILTQWLKQAPEGFVVEPVYATHDETYRYAKNFKESFFPDQYSDSPDGKVVFGWGDIFLGLDLNHHLPIIHHYSLHEMFHQGVDVYFVVYDLLPVQFPSFWEAQHGVTEAHRNWLSVVSEFSGAVCISESVADELRLWLKAQASQAKSSFVINHFHLGVDIDQIQAKNDVDLENITTHSLSDPAPTFLMVGTLEPRKGHQQVLEAFEELWRKRQDVRLLIVGKEGWLVEDLVQKLRRHPEFNQRLFWLEGASDPQLELAYAQSTGLIAASYGEGFGLPLIESAHHQLPIIARDIPVFREVAGPYAFYFKAESPTELASALLAWLDLYKSKTHPKSENMPWITWQESARQLTTAMNLPPAQLSSTHKTK